MRSSKLWAHVRGGSSAMRTLVRGIGPASLNRSFGARPLRVLTTGNHRIHTFDPGRPKNAQQQACQDSVARSQARWLEVSSNAKQLFTDKSSEYIPFDQPDFVVDAIRDVYAQSK